MTIRFVESGGNYHAGNVFGPGVWQVAGVSIVSTAPAGRSSSFAYQSNQQEQKTSSFGNQTGLIAGFACYVPSPSSSQILIGYKLLGALQCELRLNASGAITVTRNAVVIGGPVGSIAANTWNYFELKVIFATGATGSFEVQLNGVSILTGSSVQTATGTAAADTVSYFAGAGSGYATDFYCLDTTSGTSTTFLGDISVAEYFPNAAGVNAQWTVQQGSFTTLTSVANASGGTTVYTATSIPNGATPTNAWQGYYFNVTGFGNGANNGGPWLCTASTTTTITLQNPSGVAETHSGTIAFQNPLQIGIHGGGSDLAVTNLGTRPPSDATGPLQYIKSSTPTQKTDYAHQALTLTGSITAVAHMTYARKDDAGTRTIQQICLSGAVESDSATIGLSSSLQYYAQILDQDPNTSAAWTTSGFNAATFGVKEIS